MSSRLENGALAGLLVLTLAVVGFTLRSRDPDAAAAPRPTTTTTTSSAPSPSASAAAAGGTVVFLGDSMAEGKSASAPAKRWTTLVAAALGMTEVNLAHARTGYVREGATGSCGAQACPNFAGTVAQLAAAKPSAIVLTGGGNDASVPAAEFAKAVTDTLAAIEKAAPDARLYVVNPWWDLRPVPASLAVQTAALKASVTAADATWLDTGQPLVDRPQLMVADGSNPNDAGHAVLAKAVQGAIARSG